MRIINYLKVLNYFQAFFAASIESYFSKDFYRDTYIFPKSSSNTYVLARRRLFENIFELAVFCAFGVLKLSMLEKRFLEINYVIEVILAMRLPAVFLLFSCLSICTAIELTFELPDSANQCFYEDIKAGVDVTVEYQVFVLDSKWMKMILKPFRLSPADNMMLTRCWRTRMVQFFTKK